MYNFQNTLHKFFCRSHGSIYWRYKLQFNHLSLSHELSQTQADAPEGIYSIGVKTLKTLDSYGTPTPNKSKVSHVSQGLLRHTCILRSHLSPLVYWCFFSHLCLPGSSKSPVLPCMWHSIWKCDWPVWQTRGGETYNCRVARITA